MFKWSSIEADLSYLNFDDGRVTYGNYGGWNYSAGEIGGTATDPWSVEPVNDYDTLFWRHDLVYQDETSTPTELREADIQLVLGLYRELTDSFL